MISMLKEFSTHILIVVAGVAKLVSRQHGE